MAIHRLGAVPWRELVVNTGLQHVARGQDALVTFVGVAPAFLEVRSQRQSEGRGGPTR